MNEALLQELLDAGTPAMLVVKVAAEMSRLAAEAEALGKRRAADRERSQARRDRANNVTSRDVADVQDAADVSPAPAPFLPPDPQPTPTHTPVRETPARKPTACRLPDGWEPQPLTGDTARATEVWPPGALERELARFRDWAANASGKNARKSDWQAAWRNWVRTAEDEGRHRGTARSDRRPSARPVDGFTAALQERAGYRGADYRC